MNAVMEYEKYETNVLFFFISFDIFVFLDLGVIFFSYSGLQHTEYMNMLPKCKQFIFIAKQMLTRSKW